MQSKTIKRNGILSGVVVVIITHVLVFISTSCLLIELSESSIIFTTTEAYTTADDGEAQEQDFTACMNWREAPESAVGNCTQYGRLGSLRCYGGINNVHEQKVRKLEEVILCGWPNRQFDASKDLQAFPRIRALIIEYSGLTVIENDFPEMQQLQSINISWTNLSHVSTRTFKRVYTLKVLDLRWNKLMQLDSLLLPRNFEQLYLSGNPWNCTRNLKWLASDKGQQVTDRDDILCTDRKYKGRQMVLVMQYKVAIKQACQGHTDLRNCTCVMAHIVPKTHTPLFTVNCSNLHFQRLPDYLPENTSILHIAQNHINDVLPLRNNPTYREVVDVYLDNNLIETVDVLEGSYWLENFRLLSLRGNRLSKIPVYALDNALEDNRNVNLLLLSGNPWYCTCKFAMRFREFLIKYKAIVRDAWNITCTYKPNNEANEFRSMSVVAITRQDVCKPKDQEAIYFLDILNVVLALLIVLILSKLAYDYYYYKYYGRVPWIVMKLP